MKQKGVHDDDDDDADEIMVIVHELHGKEICRSDDLFFVVAYGDGDDGAPMQTHNNDWTLRIIFLCARNTPNLNRRVNACHCRLRECVHVGTNSVVELRKMAPLGGEDVASRTSSDPSSSVGGRSRER